MIGEYIIMDNFLSFAVTILIIILVASFVLAQVWEKREKIFYVLCGICTVLVIINLVIYFAWPFI